MGPGSHFSVYPRRPNSCPMAWNRRYMSGGWLAISCITPTAAVSMCRSAIPSVWPRPGSGAVRQIQTSLSLDSDTVPYTKKRPRHSARAAARLGLKMSQLERIRSRLKWLDMEAWTDGNFCRIRIRRNRSMARSRLRNGKCEFSAWLFSQRQVSCFSKAPISFIAAP